MHVWSRGAEGEVRGGSHALVTLIASFACPTANHGLGRSRNTVDGWMDGIYSKGSVVCVPASTELVSPNPWLHTSLHSRVTTSLRPCPANSSLHTHTHTQPTYWCHYLMHGGLTLLEQLSDHGTRMCTSGHLVKCF